MARLKSKPYPLPALEWTKDWRESEHEKAFAALRAEEELIRFQVADGYAWYRVISLDPLTLQHVPYGDGYSAHPALIRGLNRAEVEGMLESERAWAKLTREK